MTCVNRIRSLAALSSKRPGDRWAALSGMERRRFAKVVDGLGRVFLMRNYRASLGKWLTADPLGYPDGWNQLAYCGNGAASAVDLWGCEKSIFDTTWNEHRQWITHVKPGSSIAHQEYYQSYDYIFDRMDVTIHWTAVVDNSGLVNIVINSIEAEYTGNAAIVGSLSIPIYVGSIDIGFDYKIGWEAPTITRHSGTTSGGKTWNDETLTLHLTVYSVSGIGYEPPVLNDFTQRYIHSGKVCHTFDVKLYAKTEE